MHQVERLFVVEPDAKAIHLPHVVDRGENRWALVIGERMPVDPGLTARPLDRGALLAASLGLFEADERDPISATAEADQVGQNLRASERIAHPVIGEVENARARRRLVRVP